MKVAMFKPLAVFSDKRMEAYPDIPAFTESVPEAEKYLNIPYTLLKYSLQGTTQSRYLTGGVPPVRFSM